MSPPERGRFFCTAGRGLEPFLAREVRARFGATEVSSVSGKVFFSAAASAGDLRGLRSGERLFLLLKNRSPLAVSANKGKMLHEIKNLVVEEPKYWLDVLSVWRNLHGQEREKGDATPGKCLAVKRKSEEEENIASKRQKVEQEGEESQVGAAEGPVVMERSDQESPTERGVCSEEPSGEDCAAQEQFGFTFRVSCRCSGAIAKVVTSQEVGRAVGTALRTRWGWHPELRDPDLEIFVHLNDLHSVVGIPLFRLPLSHRPYLQTFGLRCTVAWALASLAEIQAGAAVLDPMCGLGTILLEAAKEWPEASYWGADISDAQLEGAGGNIRAADLGDKIELLKASVQALPFPPGIFDAIVSDLPFGKKFKLPKDSLPLLDILQEMERVLRVGGTLVLLLSQDLRRRLEGLARRAPRDNPEATGGDIAGEPPSAGGDMMGGDGEPSLGSPRAQVGALVPCGVYGVSLGKTEAFICKFRKVPAGDTDLEGLES